MFVGDVGSHREHDHQAAQHGEGVQVELFRFEVGTG